MQLCIWALTRGQRDQSYANGNQMGRESPVGSSGRGEACVFMYSYGEPLFSSFLSLSLPSPLLFFKPNKGKRPRLLFARTLNQCRSLPHGRPSIRPHPLDSVSDLIKRRRGKAITLFTFCPLLKVVLCKPLRPRPGGGPTFCNEYLEIKNE